MKIGRRLAIKLLNVSQVRARLRRRAAGERRGVTEPLDRAHARPRSPTLVDEATTAFEGFDYARALERTEAFFWWFCDDYVELVKDRAYGAAGDEAGGVGPRRAAARARRRCSACSRRSCPFVTEEVWSWWQAGSVHPPPWPDAAGAATVAAGARSAVLDVRRRARRGAQGQDGGEGLDALGRGAPRRPGPRGGRRGARGERSRPA